MKIMTNLHSVSVPIRTGFRRLIEFLMENAVLYFVSCCLLLLGTYSIMHASWLPGGFLTKYCEIYGLFLGYVVLLTGMCLMVIRRLALITDGLVLAGMALFLVLDPAFFNNVFYTYSLGVGLVMNSLAALLGVSLYAALVRLGGIPMTRRSAAATAAAAAFVFYYPAGFNAALAQPAVKAYIHALWWIPMILAILCERLAAVVPAAAPSHVTGQSRLEKSLGYPALDARMRHGFLVAGSLIIFYIVLSHLAEATYTYSLDFRAEYLTPALLAAALLLFKLRRNLGQQGRQLLWACAVLAACCSFVREEVLRLPTGFVLSYFRCGLMVAGLCMLYFWRAYRTRTWAVWAVLCMLLAVSGPSLPEAVCNIFDLHFVPFFFLALVFIVQSVIKRTSQSLVLAGGCFIIAVLSLVTLAGFEKLGMFLQAWVVWNALVEWHFYKFTHPNSYTLMGGFILLLTAVMFGVTPHHVVWGVDYLVTAVALLTAGWFMQNGSLFALALLGTLAVPLYLVRTALFFVAAGFRRVISLGLLMMVLAFLLLPIAYCLSILKMRRREETSMNQTAIPGPEVP